MLPFSLSFFGSFDVRQAETPLTGFRSDKARALLVYLAVESDRSHLRSKLAGLLWFDVSERTATTYLRHALANLHTVLDDRRIATPMILSRGDPIRFNPDSPCTCDVTRFSRLISGVTRAAPAVLTPTDAQGVEDALALYRGPFLEGFSLVDSDLFEEWILRRRDQLHRLALTGLDLLINQWLSQDAAGQALPFAQRYVELEPTAEDGQRRLIQLYARLGQRNAALAQFERCRTLLANELGIPPAPETLALFNQLQTQVNLRLIEPRWIVPGPSARVPPFLNTGHARVRTQPALLAREDEIYHLQQALAGACSGVGRVVWITGEAGEGKTTLTQGFAHQAQATHPELVVVQGNCDAHMGLSDPYLPFRQVLALLTGDVEALWRAGAITRAHAMQLWNLLPHTLTAILSQGPDLVDTLLPAPSLLERATSYYEMSDEGAGTVLNDLHALIERQVQKTKANVNALQSELFAQLIRVLQWVAEQQPLLLTLDDLQWADLGSIHLLLQLGRQIRNSRVLILAIYRPAEVAAGRNGHPHPLLDLLHELPRHVEVSVVHLAQADGRKLVDALLDSEPNLLTEAFRQQLVHYTAGNPLFTIELVRDMQSRHDLVRDSEGRWQASDQLNWAKLPPRVEAVIGERIRRLAPELHEVLTLAAVEGEHFTAEVIARALHSPPHEVVRWLSRELDRQHQLIALESIQPFNQHPITTYRFRHILFQKYLYNQLDQAERTYLHAAVGETLAALFADRTEAISPVTTRLAHHFAEARQWSKAAGYCQQASKRALQLAATDEAIAQSKRGIALLQQLEQTTETLQQELALQLLQGVAWQQKEGYTSPHALWCYERAEELSLQVGRLSELFLALVGLCSTYRIRAHLQASLVVGERMIRLAEEQKDPNLLAIAQINTAPTLIHIGRLNEARHHLEAALAQPGAEMGLANLHLCAHDATVMNHSYSGFALGTLGYLAQAQAHTLAAIEHGQQLEHPNSHAFALFLGLMVQLLRRDPAQAWTYVHQLRELAAQHGSIHFWVQWLPPYLGWLAFEEGDLAQSLFLLRDWLPLDRLQGETVSPLTWQYAMLVVALIKAGQIEEGLHTVTATLDHARRIDEHWWEAELERLRGVLILQQRHASCEVQAAAAFHQALTIAQQQGAKLWELRAATSLARLWQQQGKRAKAYALLRPLYAWFTEGFDTTDLRNASALLSELN